MSEKGNSWFSIAGIAILLIFLNGILSPTAVIIIQCFLILFMLNKINIPTSFVTVLILILLQGIICIMQNNDTIVLFLKQYISIIISLLFWLACININNILSFLNLYKQLSVLTAIVAIFQFIAGLLGINSLANMSWLIKSQSSTPLGRAAAFLNEPSTCALVLFPMVFFSIYMYIGKYRKELKLKITNWQRIIILMGFLSTESSSGFIGLIIGVIVISSEYGINYKEIAILLVGFILFGLIYVKVPLINERTNDTYYLLTNQQDITSANVSTQTLVLNKDIALENFKETKGFGGGLGSHQIAYNKYIGLYDRPNLLHLNQQDANSMLLRIISELGILGLVVAFGFLWVCRYRKKDRENMTYKIVSLMCLSYILMRFARFGHYFDCGFYMFVVIYYRCHEISKTSQRGE